MICGYISFITSQCIFSGFLHFHFLPKTNWHDIPFLALPIYITRSIQRDFIYHSPQHCHRLPRPQGSTISDPPNLPTRKTRTASYSNLSLWVNEHLQNMEHLPDFHLLWMLLSNAIIGVELCEVGPRERCLKPPWHDLGEKDSNSDNPSSDNTRPPSRRVSILIWFKTPGLVYVSSYSVQILDCSYTLGGP